MAVRDFLPVVVGAGAGTIDGMMVALDDKRVHTAATPPTSFVGKRTYQTLYRGGLLLAGVIAEMMKFSEITSETLITTASAMLSAEAVTAVAGEGSEPI